MTRRQRPLHCGISVPSMSAMGHKQTSRPAWAMSALPPKADKQQEKARLVRFVPKADSCTAANSTLIRSPRRRGQAGAVAHRDHRFGGFELVHPLLAMLMLTPFWAPPASAARALR